ncbi:unnamed protein product [Adineta steineri]|uniref:G-protein coupled receptors family 1 profile domain-containing protein n=1 Tax=Adineta steineri TaxID=433720 RepID=A0A815AYW4_9BILA|nr:unnamed protein product [Adineta steineri]
MLAFNSAIAGIIVNVTCGCQAIYQLTSDGNDKLCSFRGFLLHTAAGLLYQTLCVQALHRLFVVVFATRRYLRSTKVMASITIIQWLLSITFGIPALIVGRIVYQSGSRICQASLTDLTIFLYLAMFIYFCPLTIIVLIYIRIVHFTKQHSFTTNIQHSPADQYRQRRELRFIRRLLIIVGVIFFMSFPYLIFFLRAQFFPHAESLPYAQRVSYVSLSFGFSMWMLLNLLFTDQIITFIVQINSQICKKTSQYGECSTNSACGCFHMMDADDVGVCGFLWPTCSRLLRCNSSDNSCLQPNTICVHHPQCDDYPVCYPVTMIDQKMCPPMKNKINRKWKQNAITVAGGNGEGQELNQLKFPIGIFIDEKRNIFIADFRNHRIVEWKYNTKEGQIMAGGNGYGNRIDQLHAPTYVIVDQQNHSIIITDQGNKRVIQWLNLKQQILIDNIDCGGLAMDKYGFLYVSDYMKNEVRRWKMGEYNNKGIVVAGGNGYGNQLNQLYDPASIFVDEDQSVYISDTGNYRAMKWRKDANEGTVVAGGNGGGGNLNQLSKSSGVIVDDLGQIYVADWGNNRVMRWCEGKEEGEIVVGGNGQGSESNELYGPAGLSFDDEGNLYVADQSNHRIQKFEIIL